MTAWPASLPATPLRIGFKETPPDLVIRSQTDLGPAKVRRRATAGVTRLDMAMLMTSTQLATFKTFMTADLSDRAVSFTHTHPITGAAITVRIVDPPVIEPYSDLSLDWRISMIWEILP